MLPRPRRNQIAGAFAAVGFLLSTAAGFGPCGARFVAQRRSFRGPAAPPPAAVGEPSARRTRPPPPLRATDGGDDDPIEEEAADGGPTEEEGGYEAPGMPRAPETEYDRRVREYGSWIVPGTSVYDSINSQDTLDRIVDDDAGPEAGGGPRLEYEDGDGDGSAPEKDVIKPPPPSPKNAGRYVAFFDDASSLARGSSHEDLDDAGVQYVRTRTSWFHVLWAREQTLDADAPAEVIWDHALLSPDLQREVGNVACIDAKTPEDARRLAEEEPRSVYFSDGNNRGAEATRVYRWNHVQDVDLRKDDGRGGFPCLAACFDRKEGVDGLRAATRKSHLEYLINSEKVIAAGPLFDIPREGDDNAAAPAAPVGSLVLFNAPSQEAAREFVDNDPYALAGLFESVGVNFYNTVDVSGKFFAPEKFAVDPTDVDQVTRIMLEDVGVDVDEDGQETDGVWPRLLGDREELEREISECLDEELRGELREVLAAYDDPWTRIMRPFHRVARKKYDLADTPWVNN